MVAFLRDDRTSRLFLFLVAALMRLVADAWIPHGAKTTFHRAFLPKNDDLPGESFLPLQIRRSPVGGRSSSGIGSNTALRDGLGRRDFLAQVAATAAASTNSNGKGKIDEGRNLGVNPSKNTTSTRRTGGGSSSSRRIRSKVVPLEEGTSGVSSKGTSETEELPSRGEGSGKRSNGAQRSNGVTNNSGTKGGISGCFPADARVEVYDESTDRWRFTEMKNLVLGDVVRTGPQPTDVSTVYAFGMRDFETTVSFERFVIESGAYLELTENHILFLGVAQQPSTSSVAWDVELGDGLVLAPPRTDNRDEALITRTESIEKRGAFHPYTLDGKLVVNGFLVSVHSIDSVTPHVSVAGVELYDLHGFQQLLFAPLRLLYRLSPGAYSSSRNHDATDGSHHYVDLVESFQIFLFPSGDEERTINFGSSGPMIEFRVPVLLFLVGCNALETLLFCLGSGGRLKICLATVIIAIVMLKRVKRAQRLHQLKTTIRIETNDD